MSHRATPRPEVLVDRRGLVESPRWHEGRIWFSDWIAGEILAVTPAGEAEVVVRHTSLPLCFDFLADGSLVLVSGPESALLVLADDGSLEHWSDLPGPCNDIVVDAAGTAWVNSPNYDVAAGPPSTPEQPGYLVAATPNGTSVVADDLAFPNGMAVTADGGTLLVAESHRCRITAFDIEGTSLSGRRTWADLGDCPPDGISLAPDGTLWFADVPHGHCRRVAEGGEVLQTVELDRGAFACALGDGDLYVTASHYFGMKRLDDGPAWEGQLVRIAVG